MEVFWCCQSRNMRGWNELNSCSFCSAGSRLELLPVNSSTIPLHSQIWTSDINTPSFLQIPVLNLPLKYLFKVFSSMSPTYIVRALVTCSLLRNFVPFVLLQTLGLFQYLDSDGPPHHLHLPMCCLIFSFIQWQE